MSTTSAPPPPPKLSKEQIALIRASPIHRQIKHRVYSILAISALGFLATLGVVIFSCILAGPLLKEHRWLIFHYVMANLFAALWFVYAGIYYRDVKFGAWSDQLKIDGGWISFVVIFSSMFFFYLYYKLCSLATLQSIGENCIFACESDLRFVRLSPLVIGIANILLLVAQIVLLALLFRNPIINPPLDAHGMPKPINPLNGEVMPLDFKGQPILPPELRPIKDSKKAKNVEPKKTKEGSSNSRAPPEWESEISDSGSDSEEDEKRLLRKSESKELGRTHRVGASGSRKPSRRGYNAA